MQFSISFVWFVFFGMPVERILFMRSNSSQSKRFRFQCFGWSWLGVFCTLCISFNVPIDREIWFLCSNNTLKTERQKRTTLAKQFFFLPILCGAREIYWYWNHRFSHNNSTTTYRFNIEVYPATILIEIDRCFSVVDDFISLHVFCSLFISLCLPLTQLEWEVT